MSGASWCAVFGYSSLRNIIKASKHFKYKYSSLFSLFKIDKRIKYNTQFTVVNYSHDMLLVSVAMLVNYDRKIFTKIVS